MCSPLFGAAFVHAQAFTGIFQIRAIKAVVAMSWKEFRKAECGAGAAEALPPPPAKRRTPPTQSLPRRRRLRPLRHRSRNASIIPRPLVPPPTRFSRVRCRPSKSRGCSPVSINAMPTRPAIGTPALNGSRGRRLLQHVQQAPHGRRRSSRGMRMRPLAFRAPLGCSPCCQNRSEVFSRSDLELAWTWARAN